MNKIAVGYQRIEGLALFIAGSCAYFYLDFNFLLYVLLLFAFDISMLGYLLGSRVGAVTYNIVHNLTAPVFLLLIAGFTDARVLMGLSLLWLAHIGLDRALGYGLKSPESFNRTHLGKIGHSRF